MFVDIAKFEPSAWINRFGVRAGDPGYVYLLSHLGMVKVGRSTNPAKRMQEAKTWIPDVTVIGIKPFWGHREVEDAIHTGLAQFWMQNEWYDFGNDEFFECFLDEFRAFSDDDINSNSVNFVYMMNGTGMAEFTLERSRTGTKKTKFLRECSQNHSGE